MQENCENLCKSIKFGMINAIGHTVSFETSETHL